MSAIVTVVILINIDHIQDKKEDSEEQRRRFEDLCARLESLNYPKK